MEDPIQSYLAKWKTRNSVLSAAASLVAFLAGVMVLFFTFWFTYAIVRFGWQGVAAAWSLAFNHKPALSHGGRLIVSGVFVLLLMIQYFRTDPWHWGEYPDADYSRPATRGGAGGVFRLLAFPQASANMIADILLTGPRLTVGSVRMAVNAFRIRQLDTAACASLLRFLLAKNGMVAYEELRAAGWEPWFGQLRHVDGIHFFEKGLTLSTDLKEELSR